MNKAQDIHCVLFDVDGVLTDGSITYTNSGAEIKSFNAKDGFGINLLHQAGIRTGIITARESEIVRKRANELKISLVFMGKRNKLEVYESIKQDFYYLDKNIAYVGDDLLDVPILKKCGFSCAPADAVEEVKQTVDFVSTKNGGKGAVREICEQILKAENRYNDIIKEFIGND